MALLTWTDEFSVGVKAIDSQHLILVNLLNDLHAAMLAGQSQEVTAPLLQKLLDYTRSHFTAEEALLAAAGFPELDEHRLLHVDMTKQVDNFLARHKRGEEMLNVHLLNFLRDWLTHHILEEDRAYCPWVSQQGVH